MKFVQIGWFGTLDYSITKWNCLSVYIPLGSGDWGTLKIIEWVSMFAQSHVQTFHHKFGNILSSLARSVYNEYSICCYTKPKPNMGMILEKLKQLCPGISFKNLFYKGLYILYGSYCGFSYDFQLKLIGHCWLKRFSSYNHGALFCISSALIQNPRICQIYLFHNKEFCTNLC